MNNIRHVFAISAGFLLLTVHGVAISSSQAGKAASNWRLSGAALGCRIGYSVDSVRTCTVPNGASFHVVRFSGGGFAVTSSDTELEPIIAFSESADLVEGDDNPLWTLLVGDALANAGKAKKGPVLSSASPAPKSSAARKWERLLNGAVLSANNLTTLSDVRVLPLVQSKWGQKNNSYYSNQGSPCYNYYVPDGCPCGCVATAMAQIMRFHRYPASAVAKTFECSLNGVATNCTMKGGTYYYDSMPFVPEAYHGLEWYVAAATDVEKEAIGKLVYDCAVAARMSWTTGGSGAFGGFVFEPMESVFGYQNAISYMDNSISVDYLRSAILPNLDLGYPVMIGIAGASGGHEVIVDGYGYSDSTLYVHLNLGWSGVCDSWYNLPSVECSNGMSFSRVNSVVYNIFPSNAGDILSGRVTDQNGDPVSGATVEVFQNSTSKGSTTTNPEGIYAFRLTGGKTYRVTATKSDVSQTISSISLTKSVGGYSFTAESWRTGSYNYYSEKVGNSWGNDITLTLPTDDPSVVEIESAGISVPRSWFDEYYPGTVDYQSLALSKSLCANGRYSVWECFVLGLVPTDETADFTVGIGITNGVVYVNWDPDLKDDRTYRIWGSQSADPFSWHSPTNSADCFFKVSVELP